MVTSKTPESSTPESASLKKSITSMGMWDWIRIIILIFIIVGAYAGGVIVGLDKGGHMGGKYGYSRDMKGEKYRDRGMMNTPSMTNTPMGPMNHMDMSMNDMDMSMNDMGKMLEGKTGDELNKAFLEGMIPHHEGAVAMAKYLAGSDKPELVKLGADIIAAQTAEIEQMKKWMIDWGYTSTGTTMTEGGSTGTRMDSLREHCISMPDMPGCEEFR